MQKVLGLLSSTKSEPSSPAIKTWSLHRF